MTDLRPFPIRDGKPHIFRVRGEWRLWFDVWKFGFNIDGYGDKAKKAREYIRKLSGLPSN